MRMILNKTNNLLELQKIAEKKLKSERLKNKESVNEIIHELDVQKIELELQNEELIAVQRKLINSIEEYTQLFNNAPVGYLILDKKGLILNINNTECKQLGYTKNYLAGKPFSIFLSSIAHQDNYYRHRNFVMETEKTMQLEVELKRKDGSVFFALIDSILIKDENNKFKHLLSTISDISTKKAQEQELKIALSKEKELNEMKSRFITMASHEFRTPLGSVLTSIDLIKTYIKNNDIQKCEKHINRVKSSVSSLTEILNNFLSLDKLEHGEIKINKEKVDIKKLIHQVLDKTEQLLKSEQSIKYTHTGKSEIKTDSNIIHTILLNLLTNASKYSAEGKKIELKVTVSDKKLKIQIKDYGIGIASHEQEKIFSRLFRAKNAEMIEGTGLGLNIIKNYIELFNGSISFKSKENEGSIFTVNIPI